MLNENFVFVAVAINLVGSSSYLVATLRGQARPNRVTWFLWALAPLIAFGAERGEGVGHASLMTFMVGAGPLLVFLASLVSRHGSWQISRLDVACGVLSLVAVALWLATRDGTVAIALTIAADGLAALPTVVKAWRHPRTESPWVFWLGATSAAITLLTVDHWDFAHYGFPVYILAICGTLAVLITFRIGDRRPAGSPPLVGSPGS